MAKSGLNMLALSHPCDHDIPFILNIKKVSIAHLFVNNRCDNLIHIKEVLKH